MAQTARGQYAIIPVSIRITSARGAHCFSERVEAHRGRPGYSVSDGRVGSRRMAQVSFRDVENNPNLPVVRMMRVEEGAKAFTLRVSCFDEARCTFADTVFDSVEFR